MPISWTASARRDLAAHFDYLVQRNPDAALALDDALRAGIERLAEFPHRGRPGRREGTRELVIGTWPYVIVYVAHEARVTILRILHTAQEWPPRSIARSSRGYSPRSSAAQPPGRRAAASR